MKIKYAILIFILGAVVSVPLFIQAQVSTNFWKVISGVLQPIISTWDVYAPADLRFDGEIQPDGIPCSDGQILKRTGANDWDCASDNTGSGGAGLATSTPIADTEIIWGTSVSDVGSEAAFTYNDSTNLLTVDSILARASTTLQDFTFKNATGTNATTTSLYVSGSLTGTLTGNASTATALAANGTNCSAGNFPLGVNASGAVEDCTDAWTEAENTSAGYTTNTGTVTSIATTWPIIGGTITTTGTLSFGGLGTSTNPTIGQLPYWTGVNTFGSVATGTISVPTGLTITANRGAVGGAAAIALDTGYVIPLQSTLDGKLSSYDAWTHPSAGVSATTSSMIFTNASSTFTGNLNITGNSTTTNATTTTLYVSGSLYGAGLASCDTTTGKLLWTAGVFSCGTDFNTGGGSGGGTWSTTTSTVTGQFINYPNNADDIVAIGDTSTTTAEFWFDPNQGLATFGTGATTISLSGTAISYIKNGFNFGIGTDTPYAALSVVGQTASEYFSATSTTASSTLPRLNVTGLDADSWLEVGSSGYVNSITGTGISNTSSALHFDCSEVEGTGIDCSGEAITLNATGDWTGTLDTIEGANFLRSDVADSAAGLITFDVGLLSSASSTLQNFTFVNATGTSATTTSLAVLNLTAGCDVKSAVGGSLYCGTDATGAGGSGVGTISTSTSPTIGGLAFWTSSGAWPETLGSVATGTVSGSGGVTVTAGRSAVGGALAITCTAADTSNTGCLSDTDWDTFNNKQATISATWPITLSGATLSWGGLATTSNPTAGNLFYSNGTTGLVPVATSSVTINSPLTSAGTAGYVVGGSGWTLDLDETANYTWTGAHIFDAITRSTTTSATSTNLFATTASTTNLFASAVNFGSSILSLISNTITGLGIWDLGGADSFEVPNSASPSTDTFGELAGDNNAWDTGRGALQFFDGTANTFLVGALTSDTPTNGQVPKWNTGGTITWEDDSSSGSTQSTTTIVTLDCNMPKTSSTDFPPGGAWWGPIDMTLDLHGLGAWTFQTATSSEVTCVAKIPKNNNSASSATLYSAFVATTTTQANYALDIDVGTVNPNGGTLDLAGFTNVLAGSTTAASLLRNPSTAFQSFSTSTAISISLPNTYLLIVRYRVFGADTDDTSNTDLYLWNQWLEFTTYAQ